MLAQTPQDGREPRLQLGCFAERTEQFICYISKYILELATTWKGHKTSTGLCCHPTSQGKQGPRPVGELPGDRQQLAPAEIILKRCIIMILLLPIPMLLPILLLLPMPLLLPIPLLPHPAFLESMQSDILYPLPPTSSISSTTQPSIGIAKNLCRAFVLLSPRPPENDNILRSFQSSQYMAR